MSTFRRTLLYVMSTVVILLACGIAFTIGWRPFIGPRARGLTTRTFERTPTRLARGQDMNLLKGFPGKVYAPNITPDRDTGVGA